MTLHERIARCLGWTVKDCQSFSLTTLRELVRDKDVALCAAITATIRDGRHITDKPER